jgi:hypothetical protein
MVCRARTGTPRSCEGRWESTNRWIRDRKLTGDLWTVWRKQDLDIPTRKNRNGGGGGGGAREEGCSEPGGFGIEASAVTVRYSRAADVG